MTFHSKKISLVSLLILLTSLFAFSTVTLIPSFLFYLFAISAFAAMVLLTKKWLQLDKKLVVFFLFFLTPSIISFYSYPISWLLSKNFFDYQQLFVYGRVFNLFFYFSSIIFMDSYLKTRHLVLPFRFYWLGAGLLLFTGLWHFFDVFLNIVNFPFETRSHLHSTYGDEYAFSKRLTGIAREPSFFVMFIIDFIILSMLFFNSNIRVFFILFGLFLLLFSLSPSGYLAFSAAFASSYLFTRLKFINISFKVNSTKFFIRIVFFILFSFMLVYFLNSPFFEYIYKRVADPRMGGSGRAYMNYMPFFWAWESNPFSFLFGHGIRSYSIIGTAYNLPSGGPVHVTSNNLYVDTFWESGLIGLIILIGFFAFTFLRINKSKISKRQAFIAFFVLFDLMFSSVFRADFASFRFFILLYLLYVLINYDLRNVKGFHV